VSNSATQSTDIHYWIGIASSQDEQGAAAVYVTQLDKCLGGSPVQYREVEVSWSSFNLGDIFLLDLGKAVIQWNGPQSNRQEKLKAVLLAQDIRDRERGGRAQIGVIEGGQEEASPELMKIMTSVLAKVDQVKFDVMELHAQPKLAAQERMVDDASGHVQVWRIENLELKEVNPSTYGQFYGGDCYLVLYTYNRANKPQYILYMWQGRHATQDEVTASAYQAVNLDNKYNGAPVQVRVVMGKEPRHFLAIFKGRLIIFEGCSGDEREMGKAVADLLSEQDKQIVMEGQEPAAFWVALGGKAPYASDKRLEKEVALHEPRLFECSNQTGRFLMTEVADFTQDDLDEDDVMLLDTWEEIFLWIGNSANQYETQESYSSAVDYLKTHPAGRDPGTPITTVKQGYEPPTFTGWFNAWDAHKWSNLNNTSLNKKTGGGGGSYSAPGGPGNIKSHNQRISSSISNAYVDQSPSRAKPSGMLHSEQLVKAPQHQLPQGADLEKREVGTETFSMEASFCDEIQIKKVQ
ncbi:hypothetical protein cypCar_00041142, partial [Cyprinus carpio]